MKKWLTLLCVLLLTLTMAGCTENMVLEETIFYPVSADIHSLDIRVGAADFVIRPADTFAVESNLKYLTVSAADGVLQVQEKNRSGGQYNNPVLTLYMPENMMFEAVRIETGAAKIKADSMTTKSLELKLGAGDVEIAKLTVEDSARIEGGAGKLSIADGALRNLNLNMGVGELNLTAALLGENDLTFGVGASNLTLLGSREDYRLEIERGIGSIMVDGDSIGNIQNYGEGKNHVEIEGGVGSVDLSFREQ